jgi:hypothetical protein
MLFPKAPVPIRLAALLLLVALSSFTACQTSSLRQTSGLERFYIADADLPPLKKQALRGSDQALHRLLDYYLFIAARSPEAGKWIRLAKSRGLYQES